jgi:hypothetical protein
MTDNITNRIINLFDYETPEIYDPGKKPTVDDYIEKRYKRQLQWYEEYARNSRITYYILQFSIILLSALIPVINVFPSDSDKPENIRIWSAILGALIVILLGVLQITKSKENWISYRATAELMKSEYQKFKMEIGEYAISDTVDEQKRNQFFITRMETIFS